MPTKTKRAKTKDDPCWKGTKKLVPKLKAVKKCLLVFPKQRKKRNASEKIYSL